MAPCPRLAEKLKKLGLSAEDATSSAPRSPAGSKKKLTFRIYFPLPPFDGVTFNALKAGNCAYNFTGLLLGVGGKQLQKIKQASNARVEVVNAHGNLNGTHPDPLDANLHALLTADSMVKLQRAADLVCEVLSPTNASFDAIRVEPGGSARLTIAQGSRIKPAGALKHKLAKTLLPPANSSSSSRPRNSLESCGSSSSKGMPPSPALTPVTPAGTNGTRTSIFAGSSSCGSSCCSSRAHTPSCHTLSTSTTVDPGAAAEGPTSISSSGNHGHDSSQDTHHQLDGFLLPPAALSAVPKTPLAMEWPALPCSQEHSSSSRPVSSSSRHAPEAEAAGRPTCDRSSRQELAASSEGRVTSTDSSSSSSTDRPDSSNSNKPVLSCEAMECVSSEQAEGLTPQHELQEQLQQEPHAVTAIGAAPVTPQLQASGIQQFSGASSHAESARAPANFDPSSSTHTAAAGPDSINGATSAQGQASCVPATATASATLAHAGNTLEARLTAEPAVLSPATPQLQQQQPRGESDQQQASVMSGGPGSYATGWEQAADAGSAFKYGFSWDSRGLTGAADTGLQASYELPVDSIPDQHDQLQQLQQQAQLQPCGDLELLLLRQRAGMVSEACLHCDLPGGLTCGCVGAGLLPDAAPAQYPAYTGNCAMSHAAAGGTSSSCTAAGFSAGGMLPGGHCSMQAAAGITPFGPGLMAPGMVDDTGLAAQVAYQQQQLSWQDQQRHQQEQHMQAAVYRDPDHFSLSSSLPYGVPGRPGKLHMPMDCSSDLQLGSLPSPLPTLMSSSWDVAQQATAHTAAVAAAVSSAFGVSTSDGAPMGSWQAIW